MNSEQLKQGSNSGEGRGLKVLARRELKAGEAPDVSFVPPLMRRRLSPLQKVFFHLANFQDQPKPANVVFASRDGEDTQARRIVEDFTAGSEAPVKIGPVSPQRFSSSVYNAAPGLWSVLTANPAPYTAIAAGDATEKRGLFEAEHSDMFPVLFVYAEETGGGHGYSILYDRAD